MTKLREQKIDLETLIFTYFRQKLIEELSLILWLGVDAGSSKTQYVHAIWQWSPFLPRKRASQARDPHIAPSSHNQIQVL